MQVAIWALLTLPRHFSAALCSDDNTAKVSVRSMIPLLLQRWSQQADVWTCLLLARRIKAGNGL